MNMRSSHRRFGARMLPALLGLVALAWPATVQAGVSEGLDYLES